MALGPANLNLHQSCLQPQRLQHGIKRRCNGVNDVMYIDVSHTLCVAEGQALVVEHDVLADGAQVGEQLALHIQPVLDGRLAAVVKCPLLGVACEA